MSYSAMTKKKTSKDQLIEAIQVAESMKGLRDHFFFVKEVLGNKDLTKYTHGELCEIIQKKTKKKYKLILLPRGSFKTTIVTIGYAIKSIIKNRDIRILINSDTYDNSLKYLSKIKQNFESCEKLKWLYGDFVGDKWRETEITVKDRTMIHKEPTIVCGSIDVRKVGMHYDLIINDDLVNDVNTQTSEQISKTIDFFRAQTSVLEPDGEIIVVGTRWHYNDLYGHIIEEMGDQFDIYIKKAIDDKGALFFPQRLDRVFLENVRKIQGTSLFSNQYQNMPLSQEDQIFKNINTFREIPQEPLYISIAIDPAVSLDKQADYTGIVICGTNEREQIFVLDALNLKLNPDELIETIFHLNKMWKPNVVGIETIAFQKVLKFYIDKYQTDNKVFMPIEEIKGDNRKSKYMRISALQPFFERKQLFIRESLDILIEQLKMYPKTIKDDLADALSMHLTLYRTPFTNEIEEIDEEPDRRGKCVFTYRPKGDGLTDEDGLLN